MTSSILASAFNFDKYNDTEVDTQMTPYDYGSVMHYSANAFAINSSAPTIVAVFNSSANLGQRIQLSPIDILEIQRYYSCASLSVERSFILLKSIMTILIVLIYI